MSSEYEVRCMRDLVMSGTISRSLTEIVRLKGTDNTKNTQIARFSAMEIVRIRNMSFAIKKSLTEAKM